MQSDASLSWLALGLTPGLASRLSARVLRRFDSPDGVFRATLPDLEACHLPAQVAQAIVKKQSFKRAEKELAGIQKIRGCTLLNWTEPEYPQTLLQIYDRTTLRSRRSASSESTQHQHRRHAPADTLWHTNGAAAWPGTCGAAW
jgi:predicted Rossmann fold nucleotide-binding protein DprA/Smf involved in DNA uptake